MVAVSRAGFVGRKGREPTGLECIYHVAHGGFVAAIDGDSRFRQTSHGTPSHTTGEDNLNTATLNGLQGTAATMGIVGVPVWDRIGCACTVVVYREVAAATKVHACGRR